MATGIKKNKTKQKKGANVISLATVDLSMSQAEVNVARTHCKNQRYVVKSAMLYEYGSR